MGKVFNPFQTRIVNGDIVEVWEGPPAGAESEFVGSVQQTLVPGLIEALQKVSKKSRKGRLDPRDSLVRSVDILNDR